MTSAASRLNERAGSTVSPPGRPITPSPMRPRTSSPLLLCAPAASRLPISPSRSLAQLPNRPVDYSTRSLSPNCLVDESPNRHHLSPCPPLCRLASPGSAWGRRYASGRRSLWGRGFWWTAPSCTWRPSAPPGMETQPFGGSGPSCGARRSASGHDKLMAGGLTAGRHPGYPCGIGSVEECSLRQGVPSAIESLKPAS